MKKRFTEEQILQVLNTAREGKTIAEICRTYGISVVTYYKWKEKFNGMSLPDAKRLRELEDEKRKLKAMLADSMLVVRNKNSWSNFGVKAPRLNNRKARCINLIQLALRLFNRGSFHARNYRKNFCYGPPGSVPKRLGGEQRGAFLEL